MFPHPGRTYSGFEPGNDGKPGKVNENFQHEGGLYDLRRDPGERYNLIEYYPEIVAKLEKIAEEAREELGDDLTELPEKPPRTGKSESLTIIRHFLKNARFLILFTTFVIEILVLSLSFRKDNEKGIR